MGLLVAGLGVAFLEDLDTDLAGFTGAALTLDTLAAGFFLSLDTLIFLSFEALLLGAAAGLALG